MRGADLREALLDGGALLRRQNRHDALAQRFHLRARRARSRGERTAKFLTDFANLQMLCARQVCGSHRPSDRRPMVPVVVARWALSGIRDADTGECNAGDDSGAECAFER